MLDVVTAPFRLVWLAVNAAVLLTVLFATVDAALRPHRAYVAVGKLGKNAWMAILGVAVLVTLAGFAPLGILGLAAIVAALVYLLDMRPKLREVGGRRRGGPPSGPYGPW